MLRLVPATLLLAACGSGEAEPDPLLVLWRQARTDAALARAVGRSPTGRADSGLAQAASTIADVRTKHARALRREIDRLTPPDSDESKSANEPTPNTPGSTEEAISAFRNSLAEAQRSATEQVAGLTEYRAGLAGSIAASCAALQEVLG